MENKEIRTVLNEVTFTNLCKMGYIRAKSDILFNKLDIKELISGNILEKNENDAIYKFMLQDIGKDNIREILKRSPVFSELSNEI